MARIFVGVSWPYANGPVHIGQFASTYLPADEFARYHRLRGHEVLMVSGSDMHGTPILVRAEAEGLSPEAVAGRFHELHRRTFERLGVSFDLYTTTHTLVHERAVHEVFLRLLEGGFVRRRSEELPYCPRHRESLPDRYAVGTCPHCGFEEARGDECDRCGRPLDVRQLGGIRCARCGTPAEFRPSEQFYLELDRLEGKVARFVGAHPNWRSGTRRVAENFLSEHLHPTSITRDLTWGVPIPLDGYDPKRFYVWFEAVVGYLSASREWAIRAGRPEAWRKYWDDQEAVRAYYFVGKDNRFHHTIVWPAMLLGVGGLQLPYDVPANEWMNFGGTKVSKSRTTGIDVTLAGLLERFPPDVIRFYAALLAPQNHDTDFDAEEFVRVREEVLANQYGNLVQRVLSLVRDRHGGRAPPGEAAPPARLVEAHRRIGEAFDRVDLKEALDLALTEVREANKRVHDARPWALDESGSAPVLREALGTLRAIATWLAPVLPNSSAEVYRMLGFAHEPGPGDWERALDGVPSGQALGAIHPLFPREEAAKGGSSKGAGADLGGAVPLEIRAATIRRAEPHPNAEKLYALTVDVGEAFPRSIVAGLRPYYAPEQLRDRRVAILANLAPRTIRGVASQGMVLAAESGERVVLLAPSPGVENGAAIEGTAVPARTISIEEFARGPLVVGTVEAGPAPDRVWVDVGSGRVAAAGTGPTGAPVIVRLPHEGAREGTILRFGPDRPLTVADPLPPGAKVR